MTSRLNRRGALRALAGLSVLAAGGGVWHAHATGAVGNGAASAYTPWHAWRSGADVGPLAIIRAGILAANAHNTQPWRFEFDASGIRLHADHERHLGAFDPYRREMMLSLGCALENMMLEARAQGYTPHLTMAPARLELGGPQDRTSPVARLALEPGPHDSDTLHQAIGRRHTHRGAYLRDLPVDTETQALLHEAGDAPQVRLFLVDTPAPMARFAELTVGATERIIADHAMATASAAWFRFTRRAIETHRDGVTIDGFGLPAHLTAAVKMLPPPSDEEADRQWLRATRETHLPTAPLFGLVAVRDLYDRATALQAGRAWQRMHLLATTRGLVAQPLNQLPELVDREAELGLPSVTADALAELLGTEEWRPTFAFRMGTAELAPRQSPRRGTELVARAV